MQSFMQVYCKKFLYEKSTFLVYNFILWDRLIRYILLVWKGILTRKPPYIVLIIKRFCRNRVKLSLEIARKSLFFLLKSPYFF